MQKGRIRVLLADDQVLFVESLRRVIEMIDPGISVVAVAKTGVEAISAAEAHHPDVIVLDVRMPELDGVQAVKQLRDRVPKSKLIMLTTFDDDDYVYDALAHGAVGYLLKDLEPEKLVGAIRAAMSGTVLIAGTVASKMVGMARARGNLPTGGTAHSATVPQWYYELSHREREVAALLARGFDNREIAATIFLAEQTVRNHICSIYAKVGANTRIKLIKMLRPILGGEREAPVRRSV